jgi:hypothetical protein
MDFGEIGLITVIFTTVSGVFAFVSYRWVMPKIVDKFFGKAAEMFKSTQNEHMGDISSLAVEARQEKALERAGFDDMLSNMNPALAMALNSMPSVKRLIMKNPSVYVPLAMNLVQRFAPDINKVLSGQQGSNTTSDVIEKLKKMQYG